jgi:4-hydroxy-2-oxoheptanedioate aldolase
VLRCLDGGAAGLHFPWISDADQARRAVSATRYGPLGRRGLAGNRGTDWSVTTEATARANRSTLVVVQIETKEGVDNIEDVCSVEGVDVIFVGPTDLSQSLGVPGEYAHPLVVEAMETVAAAARTSGKVFGLFAGTPEAALRGMEMGARYIATGVEAVVGPAMVSFIQAMSGDR